MQESIKERYKFDAIDEDEFICPAQKERKYPYVTTAYCEAKACNDGCREIPNCKEYKEQKNKEFINKKEPQ